MVFVKQLPIFIWRFIKRGKPQAGSIYSKHNTLQSAGQEGDNLPHSNSGRWQVFIELLLLLNKAALTAQVMKRQKGN